MKYTQLFPTVLMALDVLSATAYAVNGDWRRTVYGLAAATLTATVTF